MPIDKTLRAISVVVVAAVVQATLAPSALAIGVAPGAATAVQREQAQAKFVRGKDLFGKKKYEEALVEFRASIDIVASPNARLYVARTLRALGRDVEAYVELGRTEVEAKELAPQDPRYAKTGEAAAAERKELEPKLGFVTFTIENASDATVVEVNGEEVKRAGWGEPVPVMPGPTTMVVKSPGKEPIKKELTLAAGQKVSETLDAGATGGTTVVEKPVDKGPPPAKPSSDGPDLRTWAWVAGGIGVAGLATFGVFGALSSSKYSSLKDECGGPCPESKRDEVESGRTQQTIANVGLVVGVIGVATGVTLFVLGSKSKPASSEVVVGPSWLGLRGSF
jgi:hypothetical protein